MDPSQKALEAFARDIESPGYRPFPTSDAEKACTVLKSHQPSLIFCDIVSLSDRGAGLLSALRKIDPAPPVIVLTSLATIEAAAAVLREGASFYLVRPLPLGDLKLAVERGLDRPRLAGAILRRASATTRG